MKKTLIIHPFLFAIFPLVFLYAHNIGQLFSLKEILIPMAVAICLALLVLCLLGLVLRDMEKAGLVVSFFLLMFFSYGHFYNLLYLYFFNEMLAPRFVIGGVEMGPNKVLLPIWVILLFVGTYFLIKTRSNLQNFTKTLNVVAFSLVLFSLINIVRYELNTPSSHGGSASNEQLNMTDSRQVDALPDIYYIILDSYAASHILKRVHGYDNSEFINYLSGKGFYIASKSRSNYASSYLSLASSLNMEYINYLSDTLGGSKSYTRVNQMIKNNKVMRFLKSQGYKFIHFSSGWGATHYNPYADMDLQPSYLSEFSVLILQSTMLRPFLKRFIMNDDKSRILYTFDKIAEIPYIREPTFVFAHILAPHNHVFGGIYRDQIPAINKRLKVLVEAILSRSDIQPIIILQADHGTAYTGNIDRLPAGTASAGQVEPPPEEVIRERMSIFNAYYLPGRGKELLYETITPVNSFRLIFKYYFGADLDLLEDRSYFSYYEDPYNFIDVTDILAKE